MTSPPYKPEDLAAARYVDDEELRRRLQPKMGWDRFKSLLKALEAQGFPPMSKLWGGRAWKKVEKWLDSHDGVGADAGIEEAVDGAETFDAPPHKQSTRSKDRPHAGERREASLLVRPERRA